MIQICTFGKSGSYMLLEAILNSGLQVCRIYNNGVDWNHQYPDSIYGSKVIFIYADPCQVVMSVEEHDDDWVKQHYGNLRGDISNYRNHNVDSLNLENMFIAFMQPQNFPMLSLKYECLWENVDIISEFVGRDIVLPQKKCRYREPTPELVKTYSRLKRYMNLFESAKIWQINDNPELLDNN